MSTETGMSPDRPICHHSPLYPHPGTSHFLLALFLHPSLLLTALSASLSTVSHALGYLNKTCVTLMLGMGDVLEIF